MAADPPFVATVGRGCVRFERLGRVGSLVYLCQLMGKYGSVDGHTVGLGVLPSPHLRLRSPRIQRPEPSTPYISPACCVAADTGHTCHPLEDDSGDHSSELIGSVSLLS